MVSRKTISKITNVYKNINGGMACDKDERGDCKVQRRVIIENGNVILGL